MKGILHGVSVPFQRHTMGQELRLVADGYNQYRPHSALAGKTPEEVYHGLPAANEQPRVEPRSSWPHDASCAAPQAPMAGDAGAEPDLHVTFHEGRRHLPIIEMKRAA